VKIRTAWSFRHLAIRVVAATILTIPALLKPHQYSAAGSLPGAGIFLSGKRTGRCICFAPDRALQPWVLDAGGGDDWLIWQKV
jgi:hypothetical protein